MKGDTPFRREKEILTDEDWYPTVDGKVTVSLLSLPFPSDGKMWRVCVWGGDDFGIERDFEIFESAKTWYDLIEDYYPQELMFNYLGMVRA